jgi:hypothetical protein
MYPMKIVPEEDHKHNGEPFASLHEPAAYVGKDRDGQGNGTWIAWWENAVVGLPGESLLDEVDVGARLPASHSHSDFIAQGTRSTDRNGHGTNLLFLLHGK